MLQMNTIELRGYLYALAQENPVIDLDSVSGESEEESYREKELVSQLQWFEETDTQNRGYQQERGGESDPLFGASTDGGLRETLFSFLWRQIQRLRLDPQEERVVCYLAACLDEDGYFRTPLEELAETTGIPTLQLERALERIRALEPAGVGARDLQQCLELQLQRLDQVDTALEIIRYHLEELAKNQYHAIAVKLNIPQDEILAARKVIRELEPRPGSVFAPAETVQYIQPDVSVTQENGVFRAKVLKDRRLEFRISAYYRDLLLHTDSQEVRSYLGEKMRQAEGVRWAIEQRYSTLQRCVDVIVEAQQDFFRAGATELVPLRMADVADELALHESTVSRTVRDKYLECSFGMFPLGYFFSRGGTTVAGDKAVETLLRRLIEAEDKRKPLSDQKLQEKLAELGHEVSRRAVNKYREAMGIPNAAGRRE